MTIQETIDILRARRETPGCENVLHFNNAGASLPPQPVLDAVKEHLDLEASIGGYEAGEQEFGRVESVYDHIAALINCRPDEIAIIENATRAWDMAFYSIPFQPGDRILTSMAEYASNYLAYLQVSKRTGLAIDVISNDSNGQVSVERLKEMIDHRVKLIAVTHVPTNGGLINPAAEIGKVAKEAGILYLLDACQSVGQMPVDVENIGCDMLSATGRKYLRAPRGTGFLYMRKELSQRLEPPLIDLHAAQWVSRDSYELRPDARRFETWETNVAARVGLGIAVDYALKWGMENIWNRISYLSDRLRTELGAVPGVALHDIGRNKGGLVTFSLNGIDPSRIKMALRQKKMNVSITDRASTRLDMESRGLDSMIRASLHYYNTEDEIVNFCREVRNIF